jgi:ribosomal protein S21
MAVEVKRKADESVEGMIRRFTKNVIEAGIIKEVKNRRFKGRNISERMKKVSALRRKKDRERREYLIKIGALKP